LTIGPRVSLLQKHRMIIVSGQQVAAGRTMASGVASGGLQIPAREWAKNSGETP
jgi:hypothetical protein